VSEVVRLRRKGLAPDQHPTFKRIVSSLVNQVPPRGKNFPLADQKEGGRVTSDRGGVGLEGRLDGPSFKEQKGVGTKKKSRLVADFLLNKEFVVTLLSES